MLRRFGKYLEWALLPLALMDLLSDSPILGLASIHVPVSLLALMACSVLLALTFLHLFLDPGLLHLRSRLLTRKILRSLAEVVFYASLAGGGLFTCVQTQILCSFWKGERGAVFVTLRTLPMYIMFSVTAILWITAELARGRNDAEELLCKIARSLRWSLLFVISISPFLRWMSLQIVFLLTVSTFSLIFGGLLRIFAERQQKAFNYRKTIWIIGVVLTIILSGLVLAKCTLPRNYDDFPFFIQSLSSVMRGELMRVSWILDTDGIGMSYLGDHFSPILLILLPFYAIWPGPEVLCILQVILITASAIPLYMICKRRFPDIPVISFAMSFAYLMSPWVQKGLFYDFHQDAFKPFFAFFAFYAMDTKRWKSYALGLTGLLLTKEDTFLVVIALGIYAMLFAKEYKIGALTILAGLIYGAVIPGFIMPAFSEKGSYHYVASRYSHLGETQWDVMAGVLMSPVETSQHIFDTYTLYTVLYLALPLAFLPLITIQGFVLTTPVLMQMFLSNWVYTRTAYFHYGFAIFPLIMLASIEGLGCVRRRAGSFRNTATVWFASYLIVAAALFSFLYTSHLERTETIDTPYLSDAPLSYRFHPSNFIKTDREKQGWRFIKEFIPRGKSVATTHRYVAHFSDRPVIRLLPNVNNVDYMFCDMAGAPYGIRAVDVRRQISDVLSTGEFGVIAEENGFILAKRGADVSRNNEASLSIQGRHEAEYRNSNTGSIVRDLGAVNGYSRYVNPLRNKDGFLVFGCYDTLPPGKYSAHYRLKFNSLRGERNLATLLVNTDAGRTVVAERTLSPDEAKSTGYDDYSVPFTLSSDTKLEFRIIWPGHSEVWIDRIDITNE